MHDIYERSFFFSIFLLPIRVDLSCKHVFITIDFSAQFEGCSHSSQHYLDSCVVWDVHCEEAGVGERQGVCFLFVRKESDFMFVLQTAAILWNFGTTPNEFQIFFPFILIKEFKHLPKHFYHFMIFLDIFIICNALKLFSGDLLISTSANL